MQSAGRDDDIGQGKALGTADRGHVLCIGHDEVLVRGTTRVPLRLDLAAEDDRLGGPALRCREKSPQLPQRTGAQQYGHDGLERRHAGCSFTHVSSSHRWSSRHQVLGPQGPGVLSIRHDRPIQCARPRSGNTASAPVRGRKVVNNDPDICPITRERRGPCLVGRPI